MTKTIIQSAILLIATFAAVTAIGQSQPQIITVPLSKPGEQLTLDISILSARIEVIGEDRVDAEFAVTVQEGSRTIITPSGSQPIAGGAYSLEIDEDDNHISVDTDWRVEKMSIVARIPRNANVELSTVNDGEIIVRNIRGHLELDNTNGPITASNIVGSVIAESINDTIEVSFSSIDASNAMALSSLNGDLILGLPAHAGVQLHLDSAEGEIYSDFEVEVQVSEPVVERREDRGGVEVRVESVIVVNINGGGPVIKLKTLNGDISVRNSSK